MKVLRYLLIVCACIWVYSNAHITVMKHDAPADFEWTVVGAGPAGICVVGLLRDLGVAADKIAWIDPHFNVGELAQYPEVPANSTMKSFINFLHACKTFGECKAQSIKDLQNYDPEKFYPISLLLEPLRDITKYLRTKVISMRSMLKSLDFLHDVWQVTLEKKKFTSKRVVLATGSHPRSLHYQVEREIPLDCALNKSQLANHVCEKDSVAVIGSSHSAVLVMKFLSELKVNRIINLYTKPIQYVVDMGNWVLHPATGLNGIAAEWARNVLEKNPPHNLQRFINTPQARDQWLPLCNKIIYAVGFERNDTPPINGVQQSIVYHETSGTIAPHLFGIGIAFPELYTDPLGNQEHKIGLNSFMAYAQRVLPEWFNKDVERQFKAFEQFFIINAL